VRSRLASANSSSSTGVGENDAWTDTVMRSPVRVNAVGVSFTFTALTLGALMESVPVNGSPSEIRAVAPRSSTLTSDTGADAAITVAPWSTSDDPRVNAYRVSPPPEARSR
jgi:hypothetical protein